MESPENLHILWWLLGFSYFIHLLNLMVSIWDRVRLKPSVIERFGEVVPWVDFNAFKRDVRSEISGCVSTRDFDKTIDLIDDRFNGLHESLKQSQHTTEQLFRDLMRDIGKLEGARR